MDWKKRLIHPYDIYDERINEIKSRWHRGKEFSLDFLPTLDKDIWGLKRRNLVVVGGRTSQCKSALMLAMAYAFAKQKKKVLFFTLEMSNDTCIDRLISYGCEIDNYLINTGKLKEEEMTCNDDGIPYKEKIKQFKTELKDLPLGFIESWGRTFREINTAIESLDAPDVVFIDYINLIRQVNKSKRESIDEYLKELREYAQNKNMCVIIGCQINRDVHKTKDDAPVIPNLWHLKESGQIEEHSDLVFLLHYPWHYTKDKSDRGKFIIRIGKNRSGRTGDFECKIFPELYKITE